MAARSRVLILHAPVAAGHTMAARALTETLHAAGAQVYLEDALAFSSSWFRNFVMAYAWIGVHYVPRALGANYYLTSRNLSGPTDILRRWSYELVDKELLRFVDGLAPDAIVATYPLIAATLCRRRMEGRLRCPVFMCVTDRYAHRSWFEPGADGYFVEGDQATEQLTAYGVPERKIHRTGIPIRREVIERARAFDRERDERAARGAPANVLIAFGGWGNGPIVDVVRSFAAQRYTARQGRDLHLTVVCGNNRRAQEKLQALAAAQTDPRAGTVWHGLPRMTVHGYVESFPELLARADVVVTKPGGISVAEVFAAGRPLCLVKPDPGQEDANYVHALECGAALGISRPEDAGVRVRALLDDRRRYQQLRQAGLEAAHPRAAEDAVHILMRRLQGLSLVTPAGANPEAAHGVAGANGDDAAHAGAADGGANGSGSGNGNGASYGATVAHPSLRTAIP